MVVTSGSQDGLCKAIEMLMEHGSSVLVEDFVYSGTLSIMNPYKPKYHVIQSDSQVTHCQSSQPGNILPKFTVR